jgi:hypothetical protein
VEIFSAKKSEHPLSSDNGKDDALLKLKKATKKPINCTVEIHDRTQIETTFDYYLFRGANESGDRIGYRVDAYFFYPQQFGLNPSSYPKEKFYNDIRPLIRFKEPRLRYKRIAGQKETKASPIGYLRDFYQQLKNGALHGTVRHALDEVHLFACTFIGTFFKSIDRSRARFRKITRTPELVDNVEIIEAFFDKVCQFLQRADEAILEFRKLMPCFQELTGDLSRMIYQEMRLIDEYCYYRLRDGLAALLKMASPERGRYDNANYPQVQRFYELVARLLASHDKHAENSRYLLINDRSPARAKEHYLHRRGELKRRIWRVLFVEIRNKPLFAFQRQFGAMVAAGLAAAWAVVAQLYLIRRAVMDENSVDLLGLSGLMFLLAGVFAYIIKDRIKEIGRSYFRSGLFREVPDQSESIHYTDSSGEQLVIGSIKEVARFEKIASIPKELMDTRSMHSLENSAPNEETSHVLHYRKTISLSRKIRILGRYPLRAVHDILRLDIQECLSKLGEPVKAMETVSDALTVSELYLPKIYYLDVGLVYSRLSDRTDASEISHEYFRLVVNKDGLLRVDRLS